MSSAEQQQPASSKPTYKSPSQFWDEVGAPYEIAFSRLPAQHRAIDHLLATLPPASHILDLGCGTGSPVCTSLAAAGHAVHGIDISPVMIDAARAQVPGGSFEVADLLTWKPSTTTTQHDAVVAIFSLIAQVTPQDIREFFPRVAAWLRPGGTLIFGTVPIPGELIPVKWMGRETLCSGLSVEENVRRIEEAGFDVVKQEVEKFMPKGEEAGLCKKEDVWEEEHLFVWARKK